MQSLLACTRVTFNLAGFIAIEMQHVQAFKALQPSKMADVVEFTATLIKVELLIDWGLCI